MTASYLEQVKSNTIVFILDFISTKNPQYKTEAIKGIEELAKAYKVPIKKSPFASDLFKDLKLFIKNENGYIVTLPIIHNSLNNS